MSNVFLGNALKEEERSYPNFNMSPLAEPLLPRFGWSEFRHFFTIQLQNTGVLMSHHLGEMIHFCYKKPAKNILNITLFHNL